MKEASDRTVSIVLICAILSASMGFFIITTDMGGDFSLLTGFATTQPATVNATVAATTAISITPTIIEFGSGTLSGLSSGAPTPINTTGPNPGGFSTPSPINVTNDGNTDVNITINGTLPSVWLSTGSTYEWMGQAGVETGACPATNLTTTRTPFSNTLTAVCRNLTFSDAFDTISIHIFLNISSQTPVKTYSDTAVLIRADRCPGGC